MDEAEERKCIKIYVDKILANSKAMREQYALLCCKTDNQSSSDEQKNQFPEGLGTDLKIEQSHVNVD